MPNPKVIAAAVGVAIVLILILAVYLNTSNTPSPTPAPTQAPKFEKKFSYNYAYGINPGQNGGGGNVTYLGKTETPEQCEAKCIENSWCNVYTSFNQDEPYSGDCFGLRTVPDYPGVEFSGNGSAMSGVKI